MFDQCKVSTKYNSTASSTHPKRSKCIFILDAILLPDHKQVEQLNQNLKTRLKERTTMWGKGDF